MDERQSELLLALRQITEAVASEQSLEQAMKILVQQIRRATHADCCSLYLYESLRDRFRLRATDGLAQEAVGKATLKSGEGLVGVVGKRREMLDLADAFAHPNFKYLPDVGEDEYHSFLGVPVINQGDLLGVLVIQSKEQRQFGPNEEYFMLTLSVQIASIIAMNRSVELDEEHNIRRIHGLSGTGGLAIAKALIWQPAVSIDQVKVLHSDDPLMQTELFHQAMFQLQVEMDRASLKMQEDEKSNALFGYMSGYGQLLDDPTFQEEVDRHIVDEGLLASSAIKLVIERRLKEAELKHDKEEYVDTKDFAQVLITRLVHASARDFDLNERVILVVDSLPAAMVAELPRDKIAGFVATSFNTSAHTLILARDLGIPAVLGVGVDLSSIDGHTIILDGKHSEILLDPPQSVVDEFSELLSQDKRQSDLFSSELDKEGVCLDGTRINIQLNAGLNHTDATDHLCAITDGIGLYRTEISFMLTKSFPTEDQQYEWYVRLLKQFAGKSVCMRTLDVGSDKSLPYLPIKEVNPAFGWRGVRVTIDNPQLLRTQLRAMLRAQQEYGNLEIMIPMVSRPEEIYFVKKLLIKEAAAIREETGKTLALPRFGVMVEVPAVTYILDDIINDIDFLSIGSNDLIQYLLAVDRSNSRVSRFYDPFHPAVVRCLAYLADKAAQYNKRICVCGEVAGSALGSMLLVSLGYKYLSMNFSDLAQVKYILRHCSARELMDLKGKALSLSDPQAIRDLYVNYARANGLSRAIDFSEAQKKAYQVEPDALPQIEEQGGRSA